MKTPHQIAFENYQQFLDGSLSEAARAELKGHLETCAECRVRLTVHGRLLEGLNSRWPASVRYRDESPISLSNVQTRYRRQQMFRQMFRPMSLTAWGVSIVIVTIVLVQVIRPVSTQPENLPPQTSFPVSRPTETIPTDTPIIPTLTPDVPETTPTATPAKVVEDFQETDLNCDGTLERLSGIRAPEIEYFEVSPQLQTLRLETDNGSGYQPVWELTAEAEGVAYLYYELFSQECSGLLTLVGHKGTESVQVFAWDGETLMRVLHITGRFLVGSVPDLESYSLEEPVPQNTLFITELQSLDTENVWILRGYQWDGEKLIETLQTQFRFPKGG